MIVFSRILALLFGSPRSAASRFGSVASPSEGRTSSNYPAQTAKEFYASRAWKVVRYQALKREGGRCQCCGRGATDGVIVNVDHIKARSKFPRLALCVWNLQVLCAACNEGKGAWDSTDWRSGVDRDSERLYLGR